MKKHIAVFSILILIGCNAIGQTSKDTTLLLPEEDMEWWRDAKFGLFVHYGLYSVLGEGEWAMFRQRLDIDEYAELKEQFTCDAYDPEEWVALAEEAGLKVVMNRCPKIEYGRLSGEISWAGVNSRTLSSKKQKLAKKGVQHRVLRDD